jgi:hypothetical protein
MAGWLDGWMAGLMAGCLELLLLGRGRQALLFIALLVVLAGWLAGWLAGYMVEVLLLRHDRQVLA